MENELFNLHRNELITTLSGVLYDINNLRRERTSPPRYTSSILSDLNGNAADNHAIGHSIRQIHDFYGWMAKKHKRGLCAGTIYRTVKFMDIQERDGTKRPSRNIHLEHTIPVAVLQKMLKFNKASFDTQNFDAQKKLHHILMQYSICVAFHVDEQKWMGTNFAKVPAATNEAFNDGKKVGEHPFRRYKNLLNWCNEKGQDFRIINVITGKQIDLDEFTFKDHIENLKLASRLVGMDNSSIYSL